jgi:hypothetical protein
MVAGTAVTGSSLLLDGKLEKIADERCDVAPIYDSECVVVEADRYVGCQMLFGRGIEERMR